MASWISDQINTLYSGFLGGTATAGVAGGPLQPRATEVRGITKVHRFTVAFATPNPLPNAAAGSIVSGDTVWLALLDPTERLYFGRIWFGAWGAGATLSIGKLDLNNSANTDAVHYLPATSIAAAANFDLAGASAALAPSEMTEQVGADPLGDQTTGQLIPAFGSNKIVVTGTFGGTTPTAGTLAGFILTVEEGN